MPTSVLKSGSRHLTALVPYKFTIPWSFTAAYSFPFEINSDGVSPGMRRSYCLQSPKSQQRQQKEHVHF